MSWKSYGLSKGGAKAASQQKIETSSTESRNESASVNVPKRRKTQEIEKKSRTKKIDDINHWSGDYYLEKNCDGVPT